MADSVTRWWPTKSLAPFPLLPQALLELQVREARRVTADGKGQAPASPCFSSHATKTAATAKIKPQDVMLATMCNYLPFEKGDSNDPCAQGVCWCSDILR